MMNSRPTKRPDAPRGPFRKLRQGVMRLMESKRFLAVLSLLIAIFAWSALVASDGTLTRQKVFPNVSVNVTGESTLKSRGYIVMDDIEEMVPGVRMVVEIAQQNYNRVTGTSYNPHFDLAQIDGEGEKELTINYSSQLYGPVVSCEPDSITVNVERYMTRRVPVVLEMVGAAPEGIYLDSYKTDPSMLSVSGPQSLVSKVARVLVRLDMTSLTLDRATDRTALKIQLQDSAGKQIPTDMLEVTNQTVITDAVIVETEIVPTKRVSVDLSAFVTGKPAAGYELVRVTTGQDFFIVAAQQEVLDSIETVTTELPMDITDAVQDRTGYVRLKRLTGIENTLPTEIAVTAEIREQTIERTMRSIEVEVDGLAEGLSARLSAGKVTAQLTGPYTFIDPLDREDVRLFVDVSSLGEGEHVLPVQIRIDNAPEFSCALSEPEITVTLKAK